MQHRIRVRKATRWAAWLFLLTPWLFQAALLHAAISPAPNFPQGPGRGTNRLTTPTHVAPRTNFIRPTPAMPRSSLTNAAAQVRTGVRTNAAALPHSGSRTNAVAGIPGTNGPSLLERVRAFQPSRSVQIGAAIGLGAAVLAFIGVWIYRSSRNKQAVAVVEPALPSRASAKVPKGALRNVAVCNVLQSGSEARQLWHFEAKSGGFALNRQQTSLGEESLPAGLIRKSWGTLFQRKLNVAWLPPEQVFLRVAQFPASDFAETLSMVELQLEKLSPMPVAQVVWTIEVLPHAKGNLQTVVVLVAARSAVEEFLGQLEGQGYLADRLELPVLDQLQATAINEDGAWVYPRAAGGKNTALVAWWYGGVLQNLDFLSLSETNQSESLKEQLMQMAWAGELEGWLTSPPRWHIVADEATAAEWQPALRAGLDQPVELTAPLSPAELAGRTARRAARSDPRANLLPAEFATRYQQQFVDRLWLRGLLAVGAVYMIGVAIYMVALGWVSYQTGVAEDKVWQYSQSYSNAVQLKAKFTVLNDRQELKFAALECWNYVAKLMPTELTLDSLNFAEGKKLTLVGTVPGDQTALVNDFETAMRKALDPKGQPFFDPLGGDHFTMHVIPGGGATWSFSLELKRSEALQ